MGMLPPTLLLQFWGLSSGPHTRGLRGHGQPHWPLCTWLQAVTH